MSKQNAESARKVWEAIAAGDWEAADRYFHPECVFHVPPEIALAGEYQGPAAVRELWRSWTEPFDRFDVTIGEIIDAGDAAIAVIVYHARGRGSGAEVTGRFFYVGWWRDGQTVGGQVCAERDEALEMAGQQDWGMSQNAEAIRKGYETLSRGDIDRWLDLLHGDAELHELTEMPDSGVHRGRDELRRWAQAAMQLLDGWQWTPEEFLYEEDASVVVRTRLSGQGHGSGVPIDQVVFHVFDFEDGEIIAIRGFMEEGQALEAARPKG